MKTLPAIFLLLFFASCKPAIKSADLYGTWKYIKLENPNATPPKTMPQYELEAQSPIIQFTKQDSLIITWSHKVLSHGTFKVEGNNINFTEILEGGTTRTFPFIIDELKDNQLIFETQGEDGSKVTAVKQ